jgi:hypothetical protein
MASFLDSRRRLQIPIDAVHLFGHEPDGYPAKMLTSGLTAFNATHQRTAESLCRPVTR